MQDNLKQHTKKLYTAFGGLNKSVFKHSKNIKTTKTTNIKVIFK